MIFPFCVRQLNLCNKRFSILCSVFVLLASSWKEEEKGTPSIYIYIYISQLSSVLFWIFFLLLSWSYAGKHAVLSHVDPMGCRHHMITRLFTFPRPPEASKPKNKLRQTRQQKKKKKKNHTPNYLNSESLNFWSPKPKVWLITRTN